MMFPCDFKHWISLQNLNNIIKYRKCKFHLMLQLTVIVFLLNFSQNVVHGRGILDAPYYQPNWQQYYPQRKWAPYEEQIHGRPARIRVGHGRYRLMPVGAQLMCDFPDRSMLMISNIVWERADMGESNRLSDVYREHGIEQDYMLFHRPAGSTLQLLDVTPLDRGLYRCTATALDPHSGETVTLFQDIHFYPIF